MNGTVNAANGSTITVASGASIGFGGASTTLANVNVNDGTVQFDHAATITGAVVTTGNATMRNQNVATAPDLTISGPLTTSSGTTLNGLRTLNFTGSTFPEYGNASSTGAPLVTKISANMSVPAGSLTVAGELMVSGANLTIGGTTSLTVNGDFDVAGATGQLTMFGSPTMTVGGRGWHLHAGQRRQRRLPSATVVRSDG